MCARYRELYLFDDHRWGYAGHMVKSVTVVGALLVTPVFVVSACTNNQSKNQSGTPSPTATATATATAPPPGTEKLTTQLKTPDGRAVANATLDFANGFATVTVDTVAPGILTPGFHGLHIHSVGKCEANSVAPTGGPSGDFNSAGGHFQAPGHTTHPASGDLTSLEVRSDGSAKLVTTTNAFTAADLLGGEKTALIIHEGADNFANIPQRYAPQNGSPVPDQETLATGDSGKRVACGVIGSATAAGTATTATTTTVPSSEPTGTTTGTSPSIVTTTGTAPMITTTSPVGGG
jgi:superoxide dismutase, Cu-Zn family